jgi:hypothetical protein
MTTSTQPVVPTAEELACLRDCAEGNAGPRDAALLEALTAKGLLQVEGGAHVPTPAGRHLLHPREPGTVPGLDN